MKVNNLCEYARNHKYIVARQSSDVENGSDLWFWGAWDDLRQAQDAANKVGGIVLETEDVE